MKSELSRRAEDYLKTIFEISQEKGYARIKDVSNHRGVKPSCVVEMMGKLHNKGYIFHKRYEGIFLTPKGEEIGRVIKDRHETIRDFLVLIQVPESIAEKDACIMEHELHYETVEQIRNLVRFSDIDSEWLERFRIFCDSIKIQSKIIQKSELACPILK
jgi:DtxR family Mn-dependent transcriptional regulator